LRTQQRDEVTASSDKAVRVARELRVRSPVLHVVHRASSGGGRRGAAGSDSSRERRPGGRPDAAVQAPDVEEPVIGSLTDDERKELSDKVREANKRSENGGGRR